MAIPPWLDYTPQFFTGAMEAGTAAGQRERSQALAERTQEASRSEAADRLRFAYNSLAAKEEQAGQLAAQKHELAQAAMELRGQQMQGLQDYREQQMKERDKEFGLKSELGQSGLALRQQALENSAERLKLLQDRTPEELTTTTKDGKTYQLRGGKWYHIPDLKSPTDTLTETIPASEGSPGSPALLDRPKKTILGIPIPFTGQEAAPAVPAVPAHGEMRRTRHIPVDMSAADALRAPATTTGTLPTPAVTEVVRTTKDGRKVVFDAQTKKFIRYADEKTTSSDASHDEEE